MFSQKELKMEAQKVARSDCLINTKFTCFRIERILYHNNFSMSIRQSRRVDIREIIVDSFFLRLDTRGVIDPFRHKRNDIWLDNVRWRIIRLVDGLRAGGLERNRGILILFNIWGLVVRQGWVRDRRFSILENSAGEQNSHDYQDNQENS